jgi:hypothetical protein
MTKTIAVTSDTPNARTVALCERVLSVHPHVTVITRWNCKQRIKSLFPKQRSIALIFLRNIDDPQSAATELLGALRRRRISIINWINITDTLTNTFLHCAEKLSLKFDFLEAYGNCRIKPLARSLTGGTRYCVYSCTGLDCFPNIPFPIVAKPITGSGSNGVVLVKNAGQWLTKLLEARAVSSQADVEIKGFNPKREILVEELLRGVEYEIDGFVHNGRVHVCAIGYKHHVEGVFGFREIGGLTWYRRSGKRDNRIVDWTKRTLKQLRFRAGAFHIEAMVDGRQISLIEVNPRPGGGGVVPIVRQLSGVDLMRQCVNLWLGLRPDTQPKPQEMKSVLYAILYPWAKGCIKSIRKRTDLEVPRSVLGSQGPARAVWQPLLAKKDPVDPHGREQYMGEVHVNNVWISAESLPSTVGRLCAWVRAQGFVNIRRGRFGIPVRRL